MTDMPEDLPITHPAWCAPPHISSRHVSEGVMVVEAPVVLYLHIEQPQDEVPVIVLFATAEHFAFDTPLSLVDADALSKALAEAVTTAVMS